MKNSHMQHRLGAVIVLGALACAPALFAQDVPPSATTVNSAQDSWQFSAHLLGWVPSVSGDATIKGTKADVDVGADQLIDALQGAVELGFEARRNKYGLYMQPNWISLEADAKSGGVSGTDDVTLWLVDAGGFYQLSQWGGEKPSSLDAVLGVRYWYLKNDITIKDPTGAAVLNDSTTTDMTDPVIGLHARVNLAQKLDLLLHGDIGGFGISGSTSDFSWQAIGSLGYTLSEAWSLSLGYRALSVDKHSGDGADEQGAELNFHGLMAGLEYRW